MDDSTTVKFLHYFQSVLLFAKVIAALHFPVLLCVCVRVGIGVYFLSEFAIFLILFFGGIMMPKLFSEVGWLVNQKASPQGYGYITSPTSIYLHFIDQSLETL